MRGLRLAGGELIAGASGALLLAALALPWYGHATDVTGVVLTSSATAWQVVPSLATALFALAVVAVALPAVRAAGVLPARVRVDRLLTAVGLLALALVLFRFVDVPTPTVELVPGDRRESSREVGVYLALAAALGIVAGGLRARP
jgi:hypothetical protein